MITHDIYTATCLRCQALTKRLSDLRITWNSNSIQERAHKYILGSIVPPHGSAADANASIDSRRLDPPHTTRRGSVDQRQESPATAMANENDRFVTVPPALRSGSQTPQSAAASIMPTDDRVESLTAVLDEFTSHVGKMTSITVQRDMAKKEWAKRDQDYEKSRRYHAAFATLAEQQENSKVRARQKFEELDKQLKDHVTAREKLSKAIASRLMSQSNSTDTQTIRRLEQTVEETSRQVKILKSQCGQIGALQGRVDGFKFELGKSQAELNKAHSDLNRAQSELTNTQNEVADMRSRIVPRLERLEDRVGDLPGVKADINKIRIELKNSTLR